MTSVRQNLVAKFNDKAYRDAFVAEQIFSRLPLKIRCLREEQGLTQRQLGDIAGMAQTWVSKLEDPNYGKLTIATILKVASALDVGLQIDFVPYSTVLGDAVHRTAASFSVTRFANDPGMSTQGFLTGAGTGNIQGAVAGNVVMFPSGAEVVAADARAARTAPRVTQPLAV